MPRTAKKKTETPTSPQTKLTSVIKSARDFMRKDAGLNGDLDRIPQLAWLLFLKAFDGLEQNREVTETKHRPAIETPFRWRDWAADPNGRTGDVLVKFVNDELLPYLRGLIGSGTHDPRDVLSAVFKETNNRMLSGYLLRDVVNRVNEINFASADDIHTMAHLYESMLREMRDAAGDSGEFYTPRPVIRFVVQQVDPKVGEIVLDPACGTGGFLVEALEHIAPTVKTTNQRRALHENLRGVEKKPLPYLLGMMNLVLHQVGQPNIIRGNALSRPITQISKAERVDVILTNPPFGGEEEKSLQSNFPADKQTGDTALLFLQLVIRQLKEGGRCGIVVPNSLLFGEGVGAKVREQLLTECNLHTIVQLPAGAFEPYTDIPSNLLFFEKGSRTREVWYYELPRPEGRKKYSKTNPIQSEHFETCRQWWNDRIPSPQAWRVSIAEIERAGYILDFRNPHSETDLAHRPLTALVDEALKAGESLVGSLRELDARISNANIGLTDGSCSGSSWSEVALHEFLEPVDDKTRVDPSETYRIAGVYSFGRGLIDRGVLEGAGTSYSDLRRLHAGDIVFSKLGAWEGAVALVPPSYDGYFVSSEFPTFAFYTDLVLPGFLVGIMRSPQFWDAINRNTRGSMARRKRISPEQFLNTRVRVPGDPEVQLDLAERLGALDALAEPLQVIRSRADAAAAAMFSPVFGGPNA